jgi:hypothetical protein
MERLKFDQCGITKLRRENLSLRKAQNKSTLATNKFQKNQINHGRAEIKSKGHNGVEKNKNQPIESSK